MNHRVAYSAQEFLAKAQLLASQKVSVSWRWLGNSTDSNKTGRRGLTEKKNTHDQYDNFYIHTYEENFTSAVILKRKKDFLTLNREVTFR
jgi:hypothetical protein